MYPVLESGKGGNMTVEQAMTVEDTLKKLITKVTRKTDINLTPTTTFKEMGADSLDIVQILVGLEEAYDIELMDEDLQTIKNTGEFIEYVKKKVAEKS
jgi:acyl carrier protein